jgi:hypothetical protein
MKKMVMALFFIIISLASYFYLFQDHRNVSSTIAITSINSGELLAVFQDLDRENDKQFSNQVIEISGIATGKSANTVTLDGKIFIELNSNHKFKLNQMLTIKGRCFSYDDLLEEVKIDQASIIKIPK